MRKSERVTPPTFREHAADALERLRGSFRAIIEALPEPVTRASELQRALEIDKVLGWRIFSVVQNPDAFAAAHHVPGENGVKTFVRAAEQRGVPASVAQAAIDAVADYRQLIRVHARDRRSLDMMLAAQSPTGRAEADVTHRRDAFRANSYIWGMRAQVQLRASFVSASGTPRPTDLVDTIGLRGFVGLERVRPGQAWSLGTALVTSDQGEPYSGPSYEPLYDVEHPDATAAELFLSDPRPDIRCTRLPGRLSQELLPGPVGKTGAVTCITGEVSWRSVSHQWSESNVWAAHAARIHTPCELLIFDVFAQEDMFNQATPELHVFAPTEPDAPYEAGPVPVLDTVRYAGKASIALRTPEIPRYNEMLRYVFERMGWDPARFDVYRIRMQYPIMPSYVRMRLPLPPPKQDS